MATSDSVRVELESARFRLLRLSGLGLLALTQVTWAKISIDLLGVQSPALGVKANNLGTDFGSLSVAEVVAALTLICLFASFRAHDEIVRFAALVTLGAVAYYAATLSSHSVRSTIAGQDIGAVIGIHLVAAWGAWLSVIAAAGVVVGAFDPWRRALLQRI